MDEMTRKLVGLYKKANNAVESGIDKINKIADKYDPRKDGSNGEEIIIHGTSYQRYGTPYFFHKKHYCEKCNAILAVKKKEKIVNSFSEEAKNYDFSSLDTYLVGNIKFVTYYFECTGCKAVYENVELILLEREKRKEKIETLKAKIEKRIRK